MNEVTGAIETIYVWTIFITGPETAESKSQTSTWSAKVQCQGLSRSIIVQCKALCVHTKVRERRGSNGKLWVSSSYAGKSGLCGANGDGVKTTGLNVVTFCI